ncbi:MAG: hypothetical protein ACYS8Z_12965 [Planctomycetota bacterium]|jgi:putative copper export protein
MTVRAKRIVLFISASLLAGSAAFGAEATRYEEYEYDALNRLVRVYTHEYIEYTYDATAAAAWTFLTSRSWPKPG